MKKNLVVVALIAPMILLNACGSSAKSKNPSDDVTKVTKVTEERSEDTAGDSADGADDAMAEADTDGNEENKQESKPNSEEETNDGETNDGEKDFVLSIVGDWFIDGDMEKAFIHITPDATFKAYYPSGVLECEGTIRYETEEIEETVTHWYMLYDQKGEHYMGFIDDGSSAKNDLYVGNGGEPHYVKIGEEGILGDGRGPGEEFVGDWSCGRASITIEQTSDTEFHALIVWSDSAASHAEWDYPLKYRDGKLVCDGKCTKTHVVFEDAGSDAQETVEYTDGSAEFEMQGVGIVWKDLTEHGADDMVFLNMQS